jgi:zinc-binding alcohol dehydrogenase/oxidoreductase
MKAFFVNPKYQKRKLELKEVPVQSSLENEVVVKLHAASLNHKDLYSYNGDDFASSWEEYIIGSDGAGTIVQVGDKVQDWKVGARVLIHPEVINSTIEHPFIGGPFNGTLAEYITVSEEQLIHMPDHWDFQQAAAVPVALSTAWNSVITHGNLQREETVLIPGIGGGVALFSLLIAKCVGAKTIVTSSSEEKLQLALQLGADHVIHYKTEDVTKRVLELTNGQGADLLIDGNGKNSLETSLPSLREGGRISLFGSTSGLVEKKWLDRMMESKKFKLLLTSSGSKTELEKAIELLTEHDRKPTIWKTYSFQDSEQAIQDYEKGHQFGKVIINITS